MITSNELIIISVLVFILIETSALVIYLQKQTRRKHLQEEKY